VASGEGIASGDPITFSGEEEPSERVGLPAAGARLKGEGAGLTEEGSPALRCDEDEGEKAALKPSRLSGSLQTARLRLPPSAPPASS